MSIINLSSNIKRDVRIVELLNNRGYRPSKINGDSFLYKSPLRAEEKTPSFKVDINKNIWYDFAIGQGGTIIDLVMKLDEVDVKNSIMILSKFVSNGNIDYKVVNSSQNRCKTNETEKIQITKIFDIRTNQILVNYLVSRFINIKLVHSYIKAIFWNGKNGKSNFGVGFQNKVGDWEVRNTYYKGILGNKDITIINPIGKYLLVFEGFFDFLSYLTIINYSTIKFTCIILNSLALINQIDKIISDYQPSEVHLYLDNDTAGDRSTKILQDKFRNTIIDKRYKYSKFKDLNDFLMNSFSKVK